MLPNWKEMSIEELLYYAETTPKLRNHGTTSAPPDYIEGSKISPEEEYICLGYAKASEEEENLRGFFYIDTEEGLLPVHSEALWAQARWNEDTEVFQCTNLHPPHHNHRTTANKSPQAQLQATYSQPLEIANTPLPTPLDHHDPAIPNRI